jgi:tetratricopeptide (TPR) repeat protein
MQTNSEQEQHEQIEAYINGLLSPLEAEMLEQKMAANEDLAREVENTRLSIAIVKTYGVREKIKAIHAEEVSRAKKKNNTTISFYAYRIAASLAFFFIGFGIIKFLTTNEDNVYQQSYFPYTTEQTRSENKSGESLTERILGAYNAKDYDKVISLYENSNVQSPRATFLAASAYMEIEKFDLAVRGFEKVLQLNGERQLKLFQEDTEYYLALSYLKTNRPDDAFLLLKKIKEDESHAYHDKVTQWLFWEVRILMIK